MNKHVRISLIGIIAVVLIFAIVLPALAKPAPTDSCTVKYPSVNNATGTIMRHHSLTGDLEAEWDEGTLINVCTGDVPFGEPVNPGTNWIDFDALCDLNNWTCADGVATITSESLDGFVWVWDLDTEEFYPSDYWKVEIFNSDATFTFSKEYKP